MLQDRGLRVALVCFIALELLDTLSTVAGLLSGLAETNPVADRMLHRFGAPGLLIEKVPVVVLVVVAAAVLPRRLALAATVVAATVVALVLASNVALLLGSR